MSSNAAVAKLAPVAEATAARRVPVMSNSVADGKVNPKAFAYRVIIARIEATAIGNVAAVTLLA